MSPPCDPASPAAKRIDPRVGVILALGYAVVEAATPIEEWPRFIAYGVALLAVVVATRVSPLWVGKRLLLAAPFVAGVGVSLLIVRPTPGDTAVLPLVGWSVSKQMLLLLASVAVKATLSIGALSLLVALWDFATVLRSMQSLRVPRLFVMLMAFMWRYIYLLGGEAKRMMQARDARGSQGSLPRRARTAGAMAGSLFLRGYERAERVGHAMVARGYDGAMPTMAPARSLAWTDAALVLTAAVALAAIRIWSIG